MGRDVSRELEHFAHGLRCALDSVMSGDVVDAKALSALRDLSLRLQRFATRGLPTNSIKSSDAMTQTVAFVEWLTLAEAARLAEVHRGTIKRMADSG